MNEQGALDASGAKRVRENLVAATGVLGLAPAGTRAAALREQVTSISVYDPDQVRYASHFTALTKLNLSYCSKLTDLRPLAGLPALTTLDLSENRHLRDLRPLAGLTALTTLDLRGCEALTDLTGLAGLTALTTLDLSACEALRDLTPLTGLPVLTWLNVARIGSRLNARSRAWLESRGF